MFCLVDEFERYSKAFKSIDADASGEISVQGKCNIIAEVNQFKMNLTWYIVDNFICIKWYMIIGYAKRMYTKFLGQKEENYCFNF